MTADGANAAGAGAEGSLPALEAGPTDSPLHTTAEAEVPSGGHGAIDDSPAAAAESPAEDSSQAAAPAENELAEGTHSSATGELPAEHGSRPAASGHAGLSDGLRSHAVEGLPAEHGSQAGAPAADHDGPSSDRTQSQSSGELQDMDLAGASAAAEVLTDDELAGPHGE